MELQGQKMCEFVRYIYIYIFISTSKLLYLKIEVTTEVLNENAFFFFLSLGPPELIETVIIGIHISSLTFKKTVK